MAATLAAAFTAAKAGRAPYRRLAGGRSRITSQAENSSADLNSATGQQLVAISRGEGIGQTGFPDGRARSIIVRHRARDKHGNPMPPRFALPPNAAESAALSAKVAPAHIAALEALSALAVHCEAIAALPPYQVLTGQQTAASALQRIAQAVGNILSQHPIA